MNKKILLLLMVLPMSKQMQGSTIPASKLPAGNYQGSCTASTITFKNNTLSATCKSADGKTNSSSLATSGCTYVENCNGVLTCTNHQGGCPKLTSAPQPAKSTSTAVAKPTPTNSVKTKPTTPATPSTKTIAPSSNSSPALSSQSTKMYRAFNLSSCSPADYQTIKNNFKANVTSQTKDNLKILYLFSKSWARQQTVACSAGTTQIMSIIQAAINAPAAPAKQKKPKASKKPRAPKARKTPHRCVGIEGCSDQQLAAIKQQLPTGIVPTFTYKNQGKGPWQAFCFVAKTSSPLKVTSCSSSTDQIVAYIKQYYQQVGVPGVTFKPTAKVKKGKKKTTNSKKPARKKSSTRTTAVRKPAAILPHATSAIASQAVPTATPSSAIKAAPSTITQQPGQ